MRRENLNKFLRDASGGTLIYVGVVFAALTGFTGLGIDVAHWYATQRSAQSAADAAAIAGGRPGHPVPGRKLRGRMVCCALPGCPGRRSAQAGWLRCHRKPSVESYRTALLFGRRR